jgi:hypothetical protein
MAASSYPEFWLISKLVMIFFHGQADVERGFSVNKEILLPNMKEDSLIAQRQVHDAILTYGGAAHVPLTPQLLQSVQSARGRYRTLLEDLKRKTVDVAKQEASNKRVFSFHTGLIKLLYLHVGDEKEESGGKQYGKETCKAAANGEGITARVRSSC